MPDNLKTTLDNASALRGKKAYSFGYVGGKRQDGKGEGDLEVLAARKTFKKEDLAEAVQSVTSFVQGKCWGDPEGKILFLAGKGLNALLVDKISKTAHKLTGKSYEFALASEAEEARQAAKETAEEGAEGNASGGQAIEGWKTARVEARATLRKLEVLLAKTKHPLAGETVGMLEEVMKKFDVDVADKAGAEKLKTYLNSDAHVADLDAVESAGQSFAIRAGLVQALDSLT